MIVTRSTLLLVSLLASSASAQSDCNFCPTTGSLVTPSPSFDLSFLEPYIGVDLSFQTSCSLVSNFQASLTDEACEAIQGNSLFQSTCCGAVSTEPIVPCPLCDNLGNPGATVVELPPDLEEIFNLADITCENIDAASSANLLTDKQCTSLHEYDDLINLCCPTPSPPPTEDPDSVDSGDDSDNTDLESSDDSDNTDPESSDDSDNTDPESSDDADNTDSPFCFSGRSTVQVQGKGETRIDQLQIGDAVQQLDGSYSTVYSFAHRAPEQMVEYLQIHTTQTKKPLEISNKHMLYANGHLVAAKEVKVGDALLIPSNNNGDTTTAATVTKIGRVSLIGAYAPYTTTGNLIVSGVAASSYCVGHEFNSFLTPAQQHSFQQVINGPHRVLYNLGMLEGKETYDNAFGFSQSMMLQHSLKVCFLQYFGHLVAAVIGYLVWKKQQHQLMAQKDDNIVDLKKSPVVVN